MFINPINPIVNIASAHVSKHFAVQAVSALASADYSIATRVSENVSEIVKWAYLHDQWWIANVAVQSLEFLDNAGSMLIALVLWIVANAQ